MLYGWYGKRAWTRRKIEPFIRKMGIEVDELARPIRSFRSFNDFIIRKIDLARRPLPTDPRVCIAPADGRILVYRSVASETRLRIKHSHMTLSALLREPELAREFDGGAMAVIRLSLADYHHVHFPAAGTPGQPKPIAGKYFAVTPYAKSSPFDFYGENYRVVTRITSDEFGPMLMIEVGAFTVGSIRQCFVAGAPVARGAHKGYFELGGSIVILLFKPGRFAPDEDLCTNTALGFETRILMGQSIGRVPREPRSPRPVQPGEIDVSG